MSSLAPKTLADLLHASAKLERGMTFIELGRPEPRLTYAQVLELAHRKLAGLQALGVRSRDYVMLVLRRPSEFLPMFWACVLGGVVPVPLAPPLRAEDSDELRKIVRVWRLLGGPRVVVESGFASAMDQLLDPEAKTRPAVSFDDVSAGPASPELARVRPDDTAMIQFSSGSTSSPRGVVLTHANLVANTAQIADRIPMGLDDVELGWMPHYHDMGLIGSHLTPVAQGAEQVRFETSVFLGSPERWLETASSRRATILTATNTALRLMLRKVRAAQPQWDLSAVAALLVGAEPISPAVLRDTARLLAPAGLRPEAIRACYGLAEGSVSVCFPGPSDNPPRVRRLSRSAMSQRLVLELGDQANDDAVELVECGWPMRWLDLRVVDDDDRPVGDGVVGHIQFRGPNASAGYLDNPQATALARCGDWWRTGDLGFLVDGRLTVCGRVKEMLLVGGRNVFAQDIDAIAMSEPGVQTAIACAARAQDGARELSLLFVVPRAPNWRDDPSWADRVQRQISRIMHAPMDEVIPIDKREVPRTSSGKIKRFELAERFERGHYESVARELRELLSAALRVAEPADDSVARLVVDTWAQVLGLPQGRVQLADRFDELGGTSVAAQEILSRLREATGLELGHEMLAACPTAQAMADWIKHPPSPTPALKRRSGRQDSPRRIAVVGMACRLPGANTPEDFWELLASGADRIGGIPAGRWPDASAAGIRCNRGAFLEDPYGFDATWFQVDEREATVMDPQQRLLLMIGEECLAQAGYDGVRRAALRTGVFVGASQLPNQELVTGPWHRAEAFASLQATEAFANLPPQARAALREAMGALTPPQGVAPSALVGNLLNMLAARLCHELDLRGPAIAMDTACSSSLVAVHEACESLLRGECDMALAGGVSLNLTPGLYRFFEAAGALSPTGRSRPFGADGDGFVPGEGAAVVLLRPLADAVASGDNILAVIRGSAVNNDGRSIGVMAPNPAGQLAVLEAAYECAGVNPAWVDSVECHGTGTKIGDPIELRTVAEFFGGRGAPRVRVGSVKSNIGHLLGAAGIAGLLKVILSMTKRQTPPSLHAVPPHPRLEERPMLHVPGTLEPWEPGAAGELYAGVNSFGFGGTNCHVVVSSWPGAAGAQVKPAPARATLMALSAPTVAHLHAWASRVAPLLNLLGREDVANELLARDLLRERSFRVLGAHEDPQAVLRALGADRGWRSARAGASQRSRRVAWMFPGQGSQSLGAASGLLEHWPEFRQRFESLAQSAAVTRPLLSACYGPEASDDELRRTDVAQPFLAAFQIAMVDALRGIGLEPVAVVGHSVGELAAAYAAGAIDAETAVSWAAERGRLMQEQPADGAMIAVLAAPEAVHPLLSKYGSDVVIAAFNGPTQTILAGVRSAVEQLEQDLSAAGESVLRVPVRHAFHSPLVGDAPERFAAWLGDTPTGALRLPMASTVTGRIHRNEAIPPSYWADQVRQPVRFTQAIRALESEAIDTWLELGPGTTLAGLVGRILPQLPRNAALTMTRRAGQTGASDDWTHALTTLGELWLRGAPIRRHPGALTRRVFLPAPAFLPTTLRVPPLPTGVRPGLSLQVVSWAEAPRRSPALPPQGTWLILGGTDDVVHALTATGAHVVRVQRGTVFSRTADDAFAADFAHPDHLRWLLSSFPDKPVTRVLVQPSVADWATTLADPRAARDSLVSAMREIAAVAHAVDTAVPDSVLVVVTTSGCATAADHGAVEPCAAGLVAFARAAMAESASSRGLVADLPAGSASGSGVFEALAAEVSSPGADLLIALRGRQRLVPSFEPVAAAAPADAERPGTGEPVYVVFGAASELAGELTRALSERASAPPRLVMVRRREPPSGEVGPIADLLDGDAVAGVIAQTLARFGRIDGVLLAAGKAEVGSAHQRTGAQLETVLDPKMVGTLNVARALRGKRVGFVALQSSVSAVQADLGKGLADYAAANAFLDAVARRLTDAQQPWISLGWAPWRGIGLAKQLPDSALMLEPEDGRKAFLRAIHLGTAHVVVTAAPVSVAVLEEKPGAEARERPARESRTHAAPLAPSEPSLEARVRELLASALRIEPGDVDPDAPFQALGLGSLAAVDLLKELEALVGAKLSTTLLFEHNTLAKILSYLGTAAHAEAALPVVREAQTRFPLLAAQKTFYANQAFLPELPGYVFLRLELEGPVSAEHLSTALAAVFRRHAMLRVVFSWEADELVQQEGRFAAPRVEQVVLDPSVPQDAALDSLESQIRNQVFDLAEGPLFRVVLCPLGPERACLMFNVHHIVADAWSAQIVVTELLELHARLSSGSGEALPPLRSTFDQCAAALQAVPAEEAEASARYWRSLLAGAPALPLPFDGNPEDAPCGPCHLHQVELDAASTAGLAQLARTWAVSPFHLLFATYLVCLRRWSGQHDLVVRVANARREARIAGIQDVVGCFADSLPIRVSVDDQPWPELARRVRDATVGAQAHPFTSSLELAGMRGRASQMSPRGVTPAGLSFPDFQAPERFGPVRVTAMRGGSASAFSQLGLIAWQFAGRLHLSWNHLDSLFRPSTVARLAEEHLTLLQHLVTEGAAATPFRRVLAPAVAARTQLPSGSLVHERIWARAAQVRERPAVVFEGRSLTYAQLETAARALADELRRQGVGPGVLVAVLARPGIEAVVAVLGVLASGAAYVPLSPDYPDDRIRQIATHARAMHLVTTEPELPRVRGMTGWPLRYAIALDHTSLRVVQGLGATTFDVGGAAQRPLRSDDTAYVMYTSGTTGTPKGVVVSHAAVSLFHDWVHEAFSVTEQDRFIQTSSLSFGGSIRQIYSPLLAGATVYPAPAGLTRDPFALVEFLERHAITIWNSVPTLWMKLLESVAQLDREGRTTRLESLRWILIGGEHVPASHVRRWIDRFGARHRIANLYGSTETVVNATWYVVTGRPADTELHTPIGVERTGSRVFVLDDDGRPAAPGAIGELYVGGPSLASGYLYAPEATEQAFVARPGIDGLVYRTGDLARRQPDGNLVYLGRRDTQVKIRGNRVELGEIEGVLGLHPDVGAAVVIEHSTTERQWLLAFVEAAGSRAPDPAALKALVSSKLPDFMVPHRIEVLRKIPRTSAGKLDRAALRDSLHGQMRAEADEEPANDTERSIARAWAEVLGLPRVGRHDDFFDLGGDSILALQALQRLRKTLPVVPRPMTLYAERTVSRLAAAIDAMRSSPPPATGARRGSDDGEWFELSPSQESFVLAQRTADGRAPAWSARIPVRGRFDDSALRRAVDRAFQRHPMLRVEIARRGLATVQRIRPAADAPLAVVDLTALGEADRGKAAAEQFRKERSSPVELDAWPLWRMTAVRTGQDRWELLLTVHHAIGDGWSVQVLGAELMSDYDAELEAAAPPLREPPASFRDVVEHLRRSVEANTARAEASWAQRFATPWPPIGLGATAETPRDAVSLVSESLSASELSLLRARAKAWKTSLHTVVLTAWLRAIRRASGSPDVVTGVATSGRDLPIDHVERTFGCFATGLPLRVVVQGGAFDEDLRAAGRAFEEAAADAGIPIQRLLGAIPKHPGSPYPPGREVFFSMMEFRALPEVTSRSVEIAWDEAEFHFEAGAAGTQLMLGALAMDGLRLRLHGAAPAPVRAEILRWLSEDLRSLCVNDVSDPKTPLALDSAIVAYLPPPSALGAIATQADPRAALLAALTPHQRPCLVEALETRFGVSGTVLLPIFADELASVRPDYLARLVADAVELAASRGARVVSLAGMLPSHTGYAVGVEAELLTRGRSAPSVRLTTGHAATAIAVATTTQAALRALGWDPSRCSLGLLGFGSIGQTTLELLLDDRWTPTRIVIAEKPSRIPLLESPVQRVRSRFAGPVSMVASDAAVPDELLACEVIVAATSEGDVVDISLLKPGTLLVDDSFPAAVDPGQAIARMTHKGDVVVLRGGQLDLGPTRRHVLAQVPPAVVGEALRRLGIDGVPGCRAESILAAAEPNTPVITGLVQAAQAHTWKQSCAARDVGPAPLHCGTLAVDIRALDGMKRMSPRGDGR